jgi:Excalibur calcium-binding domain
MHLTKRVFAPALAVGLLLAGVSGASAQTNPIVPTYGFTTAADGTVYAPSLPFTLNIQSGVSTTPDAWPATPSSSLAPGPPSASAPTTSGAPIGAAPVSITPSPPASWTPPAASTPPGSAPAITQINGVTCTSFATQPQAQVYFLAHGGPGQDVAHLDAEHDGIACEGLPGTPRR